MSWKGIGNSWDVVEGSWKVIGCVGRVMKGIEWVGKVLEGCRVDRKGPGRA